MNSRSKAVRDEEWVTIVFSTGVIPALPGTACNGLKLQTGRPLSYDIWKSLFKNFLCFIHCIVPTFLPLADARVLQTSCWFYAGHLLVQYVPSP